MRAFLALDLDDDFMSRVAAVGESLRGHRRLSRARWVAAGVMHLTLRFLGDTDEALAPALGDVVARLGEAARARGPIAMAAPSLVAFPDARRARVLGIALEGDALGALAGEAEQRVVALGLAPERRDFRGHLTLARLREPADVREIVAGTRLELPEARATAVTLYESVLGKTGPTYTARASARL